MMQVVLSIQAGKILPSTLLRKLGSHSRQNRLNRAFRELGRVVRTLFLLRYISEADLRRSIRTETTKVESYNDFLDWVGFGGPVLKSDDPVEQEKQVKYMDLVANVIMLHNVHDLTGILADMEAEGWRLTRELLAGLSPYISVGQGWPVKAAIAGRSQGGRRVGSNKGGGGEKSYAQVRSG